MSRILVLICWLAVCPSLLSQAPLESLLLLTPPSSGGGGGGGISFVAAYGRTNYTDDPVTVSNVVVPAGGVIIAFVTTGGGSETLTSVKFNTSETFTSITNLNDKSGGVVANLGAYILHNPTATTANVVCDTSGIPNGFPVIHVLVYSGVKNDAGATGAYRALTCTGDGGGSGVDVSVSATSGDWVVGSCANWDNAPAGTLAALSHTSRRTDLAVGGSAYDLSTQDTAGTVSGTTSLTWTADEFCTSIGFALVPQ